MTVLITSHIYILFLSHLVFFIMLTLWIWSLLHDYLTMSLFSISSSSYFWGVCGWWGIMLGIKPRVSCMPGRHSTIKLQPHPHPLFLNFSQIPTSLGYNINFPIWHKAGTFVIWSPSTRQPCPLSLPSPLNLKLQQCWVPYILPHRLCSPMPLLHASKILTSTLWASSYSSFMTRYEYSLLLKYSMAEGNTALIALFYLKSSWEDKSHKREQSENNTSLNLIKP